MSEYISISEFAARAGVSKQAVYSRLDSQELVKFIQVAQSGKRSIKLINTDALGLFNSRPVNQVDSKVEQAKDKELDYLKEQIQSKDQTIAALL